MNEIYQYLFDILTTPNIPKPYRDLANLMKRLSRDTEADGVLYLLQQVFGENEEPQSALSKHGVARDDNQNAVVS